PGPGPWDAPARPRRAAVSSFGMSGTNAHIVLEEPPGAEPAPAGDPSPEPPGPVAWVLSARTPAALRGQARRLLSHLAERPDIRCSDLAYSLATTRSAFPHRAAVIGADRAALLRSLTDLAEGNAAPGAVQGQAGAGRTVFVFPGQGSQWTGMAAELLDASQVFAARINECEKALA